MARRSRLLAVLALAAVAALAAPAHASAHDETCLETPEPEPTPSPSPSASPSPSQSPAPSAAASPQPTATPGTPASTPPKLAVTNDPITFELDGEKASAVVFVRNNGGDATARIRVFLAGCDQPVTTVVEPIGAGAGEPVKVAFNFNKEMKRSGRIVVDNDPGRGGEPGAAGFTVAKDEPDGNVLAIAALVSLVGSIALVFGRWAKLKGSKRVGDLDDPLVGVDPKWSFKESWASNITAFGGVFATVVAATGFTGDYLGDVSTARFAALAIMWTGLTLLAPVAYAAWMTERDAAPPPDPAKPVAAPDPTDVTLPTGRGLVVAAALTTFAVFGQLSTLAVLLTYAKLGTVPKVGLVLALVGAAALLGGYVWQTIKHIAVDTPAAQKDAVDAAMEAATKALEADQVKGTDRTVGMSVGERKIVVEALAHQMLLTAPLPRRSGVL